MYTEPFRYWAQKQDLVEKEIAIEQGREANKWVALFYERHQMKTRLKLMLKF